jgi:predicted transcriptional regulator of viral defense system
VLLPDLLDREQVSAAQRRRRVQRGEWRRLDGGILVIAGVPETFEMLATAALARHPTAALSHQSALRIYGTETATSAIHLSVQAGGQTRAVGAVLHQTLLEERDVVVRKGFRVTTLERTLVDLGATMGQRELQRCIEDHIVRGRTTFARLESTFLRLAARGRTGIARTRAVLAALDGEPPTESELEAMFNRLLVARNLPLPTRQVTFDWTDEESGRVDCWYPDARVIVELDGRRFHARLAAFERDRRRDQAALMEGIPTLRFTHHQITDEPEWVERVLRSVLAGRS